MLLNNSKTAFITTEEFGNLLSVFLIPSYLLICTENIGKSPLVNTCICVLGTIEKYNRPQYINSLSKHQYYKYTLGKELNQDNVKDTK